MILWTPFLQFYPFEVLFISVLLQLLELKVTSLKWVENCMGLQELKLYVLKKTTRNILFRSHLLKLLIVPVLCLSRARLGRKTEQQKTRRDKSRRNRE